MTFEEFYKDRIEGEPLDETSIKDTWNYQQSCIEALEKDLEQQKFNNKHNLSIGQQVADRINSLEFQNKIMREVIEFANENLEVYPRRVLMRIDEVLKKLNG